MKGRHEVVWKLLFTPVKSTEACKQNACMWAHAYGYFSSSCMARKQTFSVEWKDVISAGLKAQKVVPNIYGTGFVVLGARTSKMSIKAKCPT